METVLALIGGGLLLLAIGACAGYVVGTWSAPAQSAPPTPLPQGRERKPPGAKPEQPAPPTPDPEPRILKMPVPPLRLHRPPEAFSVFDGDDKESQP